MQIQPRDVADLGLAYRDKYWIRNALSRNLLHPRLKARDEQITL
jgi:hypothetical protein